MMKFTIAIVALAVLVINCIDAAPTRQDLQPRDGYVPVYVRVGDEPLAKINPDLAEAFNEPTENSKSDETSAVTSSQSISSDDHDDDDSEDEDDAPFELSKDHPAEILPKTTDEIPHPGDDHANDEETTDVGTGDVKEIVPHAAQRSRRDASLINSDLTDV